MIDIGTGTGKWCIDFGDVYPSATIIGTDLSPIQPGLTPPNVRFEVDDCSDDWLYKRPFDFIHIRGLYGCVSDWDRLYSQAFQHLSPGGYIEQVEASPYIQSDDGSHENTKMNECGVIAQQAGKKFGKSLNTLNEMETGMIKAGFVDVTVRTFKLPVGPWAKDRHLKTVGKYLRLAWEESLEMWCMFLFTNVMGVCQLLCPLMNDSPANDAQWSREAVELFLMEIRRELYDSKIHAYNLVYV